jgi:1,6-anhydro-N-acetylmuramate kinase
MKKHRSTQIRVSNDPQNSNFEAGTALENLRAEMIDIEALARAAEAAADALPFPANDRQRLLFGRIQSLATKTSQQASASLRFASALVTALATLLEARRSATGR